MMPTIFIGIAWLNFIFQAQASGTRQRTGVRAGLGIITLRGVIMFQCGLLVEQLKDQRFIQTIPI